MSKFDFVFSNNDGVWFGIFYNDTTNTYTFVNDFQISGDAMFQMRWEPSEPDCETNCKNRAVAMEELDPNLELFLWDDKPVDTALHSLCIFGKYIY